MKQRDSKGFSRRAFLKTTAGAGTVALAGLSSEQAQAQSRPVAWDRESDVVVIGSGAAGLPTAIAAAESSASVVLIEANWDVGGHAALSGGNVYFDGAVITGLYCKGESAGGFSLHGLARCAFQGRIAGMNAAAET